MIMIIRLSTAQHCTACMSTPFEEVYKAVFKAILKEPRLTLLHRLRQAMLVPFRSNITYIILDSRDVCRIRCPTRLQERPDILAVVSSSLLLRNARLSVCAKSFRKSSLSARRCHVVRTTEPVERHIAQSQQIDQKQSENPPKIGPQSVPGTPRGGPGGLPVPSWAQDGSQERF